MRDAKKLQESATVIFNSVVFFLPEIAMFLDGLVEDDIVTIPGAVNALIKAVATINLYLRIFKTKQPVALRV